MGFRGQRGRGSYNRYRGRGKPSNFAGANKSGSAKVTRTADGLVIENDREGTESQEKWNRAEQDREIDEGLGFSAFEQGSSRVGWLINIQPTLVKDSVSSGDAQAESSSQPSAAVDLYFLEDDGGAFRSTMVYNPYFLIASRSGKEAAVEEWVRKKYDGLILKAERVLKDDLKLPNHLTGLRRQFIKLSFRNVDGLLRVRRDLLALATKNSSKLDALDAYAEVIDAERHNALTEDFEDHDFMEFEGFNDSERNSKRNKQFGTSKSNSAMISAAEPSEWVIDIREYDVPYYLRVAIDQDLRVGLWYNVTADHGRISCARIPERVERAEPVVMAYDIETTKPPLKFPDSATDQIMMISYMIDGQGFLITNREIVSSDIADFDYTPKAEYEGPFTIFNEENEAAVIRRWFDHIRDARPTVMATYNGDSFDFPFVYARATVHGLDMFKEIGFHPDSEGEFKSRTCIHMDCYKWVKRDSYLPQGSQGLKAVTVAKLGYNPIELDPELMTPYAVEQPQILAQYSVSDAVATYYLYMKYVHPFIFSLCNIIPLNPDEVLRKGSGTLCETLLMVEAYNGGIVMPNRHVHEHGAFYEGHLIESETYVGGHVEALEAGVFRSDIPANFKLVPSRCQQLLDELDSALKFSIVQEGELSLDDVENYDEVKTAIQTSLETMRDHPIRLDPPIIYHLDVAAMYPNIMLSNRLQPDSVVDEAMCAACSFNRPGKTCDRRMTWAWRGEYFPAKLDEYKMVRNALESESFPAKWPSTTPRKFSDLSPSEQTSLLHKRLGDYSRKVYKKTHETKIVEKEAIICQRENPFYIDTVRAFRDRRYTYKGLHKQWKKTADQAQQEGRSLGEIAEAKKMIVIYDSLQLAHKCILNSFYGYVMRKGARWHSMEMAGITCLTGAKIIQMAREIIEEVGRPLELDTDGIWCMLPGIFPENFTFKLKNGKKYGISYPCSMLNHLVHQKFTNHQYHQLNPETKHYEVRSENSIFFELDGPYRAMILPSSKEEDKLLKKRYAVFNHDGSLAELKGFEVKRRGELQLIKIFQTAIFEKFLLGTTLKECYDAVAEVANRWLDVLATKAVSMHDEELVDLICENRSMSKTLTEYGAQKSTSIRTAKRLAEFLGDQMVKDKGLSCRFIISAKPHGSPVTERAVPVAIFSTEPSIQQHFLRKWLKDNSLVDFSLRSILDWDYYIERLGSVIQKLITIPAAMQKVLNPVPRIHHPDWLARRLATREDTFKQHKITDMFTRQKPVDPQLLEAARAAKLAMAPKQVTILEKTVEERLPSIPSIHQNYTGWIAAMKPRWRMSRKMRKERGKNQIGNFGSSRLRSMIEIQNQKYQSSQIEILQINSNPNKPGEFECWLMINDLLQFSKIKIEREFYLNLKNPKNINDNNNYNNNDDDQQQQQQQSDFFFPNGCSIQSVMKNLPRSQNRLYLYKIMTSEINFIDQTSKFQRMIRSPEVEGVYELQVPLLERLMIQIGTRFRISPKSKISLALGIEQGFKVSDLIRVEKSMADRHYLNRGRSLRYLLIYHFQSGTRHSIGLFQPHNNSIKIFLTDRSQSTDHNEQLSRSVGVYYEKVRENKAKEQAGVFEYSSRMKVEVLNVKDETLALKGLSKELTLLKGQKNVGGASGAGGGLLVMIRSKHERSYYEQSVLSISKFPVIMVKSNQADHKFEAFGWQKFSTDRMIQHYIRSSYYLYERINQAEQFDVPIGNFERVDGARMLMDLEFSRRLIASDCLLWWSPSSKADLGGMEADLNTEHVLDLVSNPEVSVMGTYTDATIEVRVGDLAINSILQSSWVYEMESGSSFGFQNASHNLDEYSKGLVNTTSRGGQLGDSDLSVQTFTLFRSLVKTWVIESARVEGGDHYRGLLRHLWRWMSSPSSKMYEPALYRFVHGLMKKVFSQLLAELRRLGTKVVYGDFNRIFLSTNRVDCRSAFGYSSYIVSAVNGRELFKFIDLEIVRFWEELIWVDVANFGGIICEDPEKAEEEKDDDDDDGQVENVTMHWNMVNFLPIAIQQDFLRVVCGFIHDLYQCKIQSIKADSGKGGNGMTDEDRKRRENEMSRELVEGELTRRMLKWVNRIEEREIEAMRDVEGRKTFEFPRLPGSHLKMKKPSLEFVKMVCFVIERTGSVSGEVGRMKRACLDLIGVREFSRESVFKNPCVGLKIPMVICDQCSMFKAFDLCRDPDLVARFMGPLTTEGGGGIGMLECSQCGQAYEKTKIEVMVIDGLMKQIAAYQLDDLRCSRCEELKEDEMSMSCSRCSGEYKEGGNRAQQLIRRNLIVAKSVGEAHGMEHLLELVEDLTMRSLL